MARTVEQIFNEQKDEAIRLATLANDADLIAMFNNTSAFASWRVLFYIMAYTVWSLENLWDIFQKLINDTIAQLTPHTTRWYRTKALLFQFGMNLLPDSDKFDNTGFTNQQIIDSKIIKYAAVNEATIQQRRSLLIKVAGVDAGGNLQPITAPQLDAFTAYIEEIKDAGVYVVIYNRSADLLRTEIDVYYNPLLLDVNGNRLDGLAGKPIEDACKSYLLQLPFNGEFSNAAFIDSVQNAFGVSDRNVFLKSMLRGLPGGVFAAVPNSFIPEAGYVNFDLVNGLVINYIAHV